MIIDDKTNGLSFWIGEGVRMESDRVNFNRVVLNRNDGT